jgi:uncharacterized protein
MSTAITIPSSATAPATDYAALREQGMEYIRTLAGNLWTDHNLHDPGITILELLCYALTDLGYRAQTPVADMLASTPDGKPAAPLYTARQILPARPLTISDYRRLMIDTTLTRANGTLVGIRNAWLKPETVKVYADTRRRQMAHEKPSGPGVVDVGIGGRYKVLLEFDSLATQAERKQLKKLIADKLTAHRNLCEDFGNPAAVKPTPYRLCAELELDPAANPFEVLASICFVIQEYLSPAVRFYTLAEMAASGKRTDEIFEGPALEHGFLKEEDLQASQLRRQIRLSDVMRRMMNTTGVRDVREAVLQPSADTGKPESIWVLDIPEGTQPLLDVLTSRWVVYKNGVPFVPDTARIAEAFLQLTIQHATQLRRAGAADYATPRGRVRNLAQYTSIRHHFPLTYGVTNFGLPPDATDERKQQALQLHGYLWLLDQVLANYLAQLSQLPALLGAKPISHTLHAQLVTDFTEARHLLPDKDAAATAIQVAMEDEEAFYRRRHTLLNHLIARFAEQFTDYVHAHYALFPAIGEEALIRDKEAFLQDYVAISRHRSGAISLPEALSDPADFVMPAPCGWQKRLERLLGIGEQHPDESLLVIEHLQLLPGTGVDAWMRICVGIDCADCADHDPYSFRLSIVLPALAGRFNHMDFRRYAEQVIRSEVPAHLLPKICWLSHEDYEAVSKAWEQWLQVKAGLHADETTTRLQTLIDLLQSSKSIYPEAKLQDCSATEEKKLLILNQSSLGTKKTT